MLALCWSQNNGIPKYIYKIVKEATTLKYENNQFLVIYT